MLMLEIVMVALAAIRANALRSFLTTLGIIIGVAAVIAMVALGEGAQRRVQDQIARIGTTVLTVRPGAQQAGGVRFEGNSAMSIEDAEAIRNEVPLKRFARVEEIVETVALLASEVGGGYYHGAVMNISGGHVM